MHGTVYRADGGLDAIIWLVVMLAMGVTQWLGQRRKRAQTERKWAEEPSDDAAAETDEDPARRIQEFFETLSGRRMPEAPRPKRLEEQPPRQAPSVHIRQVRPAVPAQSVRARLETRPIAPPPIMVENLRSAAGHGSMRHTLSLPAIGIAGTGPGSRRPRVKLAARRHLREAMINMIVLSRPKGLE